ncbi:MAG: Hsp20/alpha crystallin family protein [Bacteroidetes bacterium]|jgi:HSP20 family protein|nr:Hsp20/alpha crystallin family protein [Bacteroidota bacterium]
MSTKSLVKQNELIPSTFNDFFRPWNEWFENSSSLWGRELTVPAVNVSENTKDFKVSVAAPGMKKDDFKIDVEGNMLSISAETKQEKEEKDEKYTKKEYNYSSFSRCFTLPDEVNKEKIEATYENGLLQLVLPKTEEAKKLSGKHIAVK